MHEGHLCGGPPAADPSLLLRLTRERGLYDGGVESGAWLRTTVNALLQSVPLWRNRRERLAPTSDATLPLGNGSGRLREPPPTIGGNGWLYPSLSTRRRTTFQRLSR